MKMMIMAGTDADLLFALNTRHMPHTLPLLTNTDIENIIQNARDDSADLQKGLIMKVRLLGMPVPIESYDIYLKILLFVGTDEDLAFTLNNFNVTAITRNSYTQTR